MTTQKTTEANKAQNTVAIPKRDTQFLSYAEKRINTNSHIFINQKPHHMKKNLFSLLLVVCFMAFGQMAMAQGTVKGIIQDADTDEPLIGATVMVEGTTTGATTNLDGAFTMDVAAGAQTLIFRFVGYASETKELTIQDGKTIDLGIIALSSGSIGLDEVKVIASIAEERKTPIAVSNITAQEIENNLGSQEFPEVMKNTPSVYPTKSGGGYGDSRINVRGFDQRNVAVLINGIPVNDMENGWVYWSNWAGLGDATKTIQIQRGLGASKLAINSVGGTINIITKTTDMKKGGSFQQSMTDFGRTKSMLSLSTGKMKSGTAVTFVGSRTSGNNYVDATYVDAWSYFLSVSQDLGKHQLVFTAIGAPQIHGQRDGFNMLTESEYETYGTKYNKNWGYLYGDVLNSRENYYHKPQMSLNWYWTISDKTFLATSAYLSFGTGGGSGTLGYGSYKYDPPRSNYEGLYDWGAMVDINAANIDSANAREVGAYTVKDGDTSFMSRSNLIMRNSVNNHTWYGVLSTLKHNLTDNLDLMVGVDARYYKGEHYREVRDLLGGDYYYDYTMGAVYMKDDIIAYHNDGIVTYTGAFTQLEYSTGNFSSFVAASVSNTWNKRIDYYSYLPEEAKAESETLSDVGYNAKLGANYNLNENHNVFMNAGYYSRVPEFRFMFLNYVNDVNVDRNNETVLSAELGYGFTNDWLNFRLNAYYTVWDDISKLGSYYSEEGNRYNVYFHNLKQVHTGIEANLDARLTNYMTLGAFAGIGDWKYGNDVNADVYDDNTLEKVGTFRTYTKDIKVPDAPQTHIGFYGKFNVTKEIDLGFNLNYYDNNYANFTPETRTNENDRAQAYKLPAFTRVDLRAGFAFKIAGLDSYAAMNCYNLFDTEKVIEGEDKSVKLDDGTYVHELSKGFWSWGRNFNFSLKVSF